MNQNKQPKPGKAKHAKPPNKMTKTSTQQPPNNLDECNVFVKYLPPDLSDEDFKSLFDGFGKVLSCKIMVDQETNKSLGFG